MLRKNIATIVTVMLAVLACAGAAGAQNLTGQLSGTVTDSSGGVLPGATATLVNDLSNDSRTTVTNESGNFVFAAVPPGTYKVSVELAGFQKSEVTGIILRLGESRNITQIQLGVGGLSEQVAVTAITELAPVSSGEKSATISAEQIQNISIVGRSAAELLKILPGMAPITTSNGAPGFNGEVIGINGNGEGGKQSALGNYSANGTQNNALDITIDGAHASDPGCNCATSVNPNPDMIQEFKVLQSNFGAENAKGPVTINVVSKAGGRDFRGTAYTYFRNYKLNSNEWFLNKVGQDKPQNKFTFPGFNIGGPLLIPGTDFNRNRDKLFFFFGYEYYKQDLDTGTLRSWVPTEAMRNGDFSGRRVSSRAQRRRRDGAAVRGQRRHGARRARSIPTVRFCSTCCRSPTSIPAVANGYNYVQNVPLSQNNHQALGRVDVSISDNTKLFFRYNFQAERQPFPVGLWWRNAQPGAVSDRRRGRQPVAFGDDQPDEGVQLDAHERDHVRGDLHQLPEPPRRPEQGVPFRARLHQPRRLQERPRPDSVGRDLGRRSDDVQPGRVRPGALRQEVAHLDLSERHEGRGRAHLEGGRILRVGEQQPAGEQQQQRPARVRDLDRQHHAATCSPTS